MIPVFLISFFAMLLIAGAPMILCQMFSALLLPIFWGSAAPVTFTSLMEAFVSNLSSANTALTIALFMIAGSIMSKGELTDKIFNTFSYFLGKKRGFMPILSILTAMFYGAISGSGPATTAAVGGMCWPMLVAFGYDPVFSAAILVCAGCLGMVIPPSIPLSVAAMMAQTVGLEVNLTSLYKISGVVGVLCGLLLIIYTYLYCKRHGNGDQEAINKHVDELRTRSFGSVLKESIWALMTPVIILGGIFTGITDTCQAGAISLIYGLFVAVFVYKTIKPNEVLSSLGEAMIRNLPIVTLLGAAGIFGETLTALNVPTMVSEAMLSSGLGNNILVCMIILFMLIIGTFYDSGGAAQIVIPLITPMLLALGIDVYTCFVAVIMAQAIGQTTPPYGLSMFIMCGVANCSVGQITKYLLPMIGLLIIVAFGTGLLPGLFTWALPV